MMGNAGFISSTVGLGQMGAFLGLRRLRGDLGLLSLREFGGLSSGFANSFQPVILRV